MANQKPLTIEEQEQRRKEMFENRDERRQKTKDFFGKIGSGVKEALSPPPPRRSREESTPTPPAETNTVVADPELNSDKDVRGEKSKAQVAERAPRSNAGVIAVKTQAPIPTGKPERGQGFGVRNLGDGTTQYVYLYNGSVFDTKAETDADLFDALADKSVDGTKRIQAVGSKVMGRIMESDKYSPRAKRGLVHLVDGEVAQRAGLATPPPDLGKNVLESNGFDTDLVGLGDEDAAEALYSTSESEVMLLQKQANDWADRFSGDPAQVVAEMVASGQIDVGDKSAGGTRKLYDTVNMITEFVNAGNFQQAQNDFSVVQAEKLEQMNAFQVADAEALAAMTRNVNMMGVKDSREQMMHRQQTSMNFLTEVGFKFKDGKLDAESDHNKSLLKSEKGKRAMAHSKSLLQSSAFRGGQQITNTILSGIRNRTITREGRNQIGAFNRVVMEEQGLSADIHSRLASLAQGGEVTPEMMGLVGKEVIYPIIAKRYGEAGLTSVTGHKSEVIAEYLSGLAKAMGDMGRGDMEPLRKGYPNVFKQVGEYAGFFRQASREKRAIKASKLDKTFSDLEDQIRPFVQVDSNNMPELDAEGKPIVTVRELGDVIVPMIETVTENGHTRTKTTHKKIKSLEDIDSFEEHMREQADGDIRNINRAAAFADKLRNRYDSKWLSQFGQQKDIAAFARDLPEGQRPETEAQANSVAQRLGKEHDQLLSDYRDFRELIRDGGVSDDPDERLNAFEKFMNDRGHKEFTRRIDNAHSGGIFGLGITPGNFENDQVKAILANIK